MSKKWVFSNFERVGADFLTHWMDLGSSLSHSSPQKLLQNKFFVFWTNLKFLSKKSVKIEFFLTFLVTVVKKRKILCSKRRKTDFEAIFGGWRDKSLTLGPYRGSQILHITLPNHFKIILWKFEVNFEEKEYSQGFPLAKKISNWSSKFAEYW